MTLRHYKVVGDSKRLDERSGLNFGSLAETPRCGYDRRRIRRSFFLSMTRRHRSATPAR